MPTAKKTWKALESRVAAKLGGKRTPLSGSNSQHGTSADVIGGLDWAYVEVKLRAQFMHHALFKAVAVQAKKEGKVPLLVTHQKNDRGELVTLRLDDLIKLLLPSVPAE